MQPIIVDQTGLYQCSELSGVRFQMSYSLSLLLGGFCPRHHDKYWSFSVSGRRRKGETSTILSEISKEWMLPLKVKVGPRIQRPAKFGPKPLFLRLSFRAEGTDPVDSIFLTWKRQAHVTKTQHYCHSSWKHIKLLCFSQDCSLFPAEGALIYWFSDDHVKLARSKIKRFWIGTLMSSCIHFYRWYLLKARVNYEIGTNSVLDFSVLIYRN